MSIEFRLTEVFPTTPGVLYQAWLNSGIHSEMTGGKARISDQVGEAFEAWNGYIQGKNLELDPPHRILQTWRTEDFDLTDPDSLLEIKFQPQDQSTLVTIHHTGLPEDGMRYYQGWIEAYFTPMLEYFTA